MKISKLKKPTIGIIGMGYVGSNYAHDFKKRGFKVICYAKEAPHDKNKELIKSCDIVFIAVPTPTTPEGFDDSIVRNAVKLVGKNKTAVIKSTILPGTTESIQKENPGKFVMHSPEFLTEATARYDAQHPNRNIVGIPKVTPEFKKKSREVIAVLPHAPYTLVCKSNEAEFIKYGGNCWFYHKVIFINELYDLSQKLDANYNVIRGAMTADPRIGATHLNPIHKSGRGAGGHCFIKDFAAFTRFYSENMKDPVGLAYLHAAEEKNTDLLVTSGKDIRLLTDVYGERATEKARKKGRR